uniref:Uncharacterized protein LOC111110379 isoform X1 n=1 Tax=Crassostrea virginica TaxID=6565 RepID=A0A8B8BHY2_CRAVI|nr:uncharacterized protein LOC111110379 isoform X1 [Crassostrea virginica]
MFYVLGALVLVNLGSAQIFQIEIANTTVEYGSTDIDVLCLVTNGSTLNQVFAISLRLSGASVLSISSNDEISWQDMSVKNREGVMANGSLADVNSAHLHLFIPSTSVVYPDDEGTYQCTMSGLDLTMSPVTEETESVFLNITGYVETTAAPETTTTPVPSSTNPATTASSPSSSSDCKLSRGHVILMTLTLLGFTVMRTS